MSFYFRDNFTYSSIGQMTTSGWSLSTPSQASVGGGLLTLVNNGNAGSQATWTNVPSGVGNWTVSLGAEWVGGSYGTLQLDVNTASHRYLWHADGHPTYDQYLFYRDGQILIAVNGYTPQMNVWHTLRMDMVKGMLYMYFDGNLITTYTETSTNNSLTQFGPAAGWSSTDSFNFLTAAALIVSSSTSGSTIVTKPSVTTQPIVYPWDGSGFYAQGRNWIFYLDSGSCSGTTTKCLYYATSTSGASWSKYDLGVVSCATPSVVTNGTHVFCVRYNGVDTTAGQALLFRVGALHADGTIAWGPEATVKPATSGIVWYSLSLGISTTGQAFVAYENAASPATPNGASGHPYVIHSNGQDYTTWQQETLLMNSLDNWRFTLVPLPSGQMYILYWPYWGPINGRLWSSGAWGSVETVTPSNTFVQQYAFGFSAGNSTIYVISFCDRNTTTTDSRR